MCFPISWVSIFIASAAFVPSVGGNEVPHGCPLTSFDEHSLLQAAANVKSASIANSAAKVETGSAQPHSAVCVEPEAHLDFSAVPDLEPLRVHLGLGLNDPEVLGSLEATPAPAFVLVVRAVLWLLSVCFFASGAMRCFPCEAKPSPAVAARESTTSDSLVFALAPQCGELLEAALAGDDARCESLLDMEALFLGVGPPEELTAADAWGTTALHAAAAGGSHIVAELFLEFGAHVDPVDVRDETPLHLAARGGHVEVCELLAKRGASLCAANAEHLTPLAVAGYAGQGAACRTLLALGAGVEGLPEDQMPDMLRDIFAETAAKAPSSK